MGFLKRSTASTENDTSRPPRRVKPTPISMTPMRVLNIEDGAIIHQQCLLLKGECPSFDNSDNDFVRVNVSDALSDASTKQNWPVSGGKWKALLVLSPGTNTVHIELHHAGSVFTSVVLHVIHEPLLQLPPLHLAIMVAKDSPLLIDCPPAKYGAFSSAHNSLDAVICKLRTTAYMWQALTAEDMREKGLGRRSFRLEEEWAMDTTPLGYRGASAAAARSLPKVHIIRSDKTIAEIRNPNMAQQNSRASNRDSLHNLFKTALAKHGAPFDSACKPVVAGLVLDSHYSVEKDLIVGHAALGQHDRNGLSLGIFGSHLTYSWPRYLEEVSDCLTDEMVPGDTVGNDNMECVDLRHACFVGQGAFLHEVGHAFGAEHTTGIMERGYSQDWPHVFLANGRTDHECTWDLQDALRFKTMPHFRIPGDAILTNEFLNADVRVAVDDDEGEDRLVVSTAAGLARLSVTDGTHTKSYDMQALDGCTMWGTTELSFFDRDQPLHVSALGRNGKQKDIKDAWRLFAQRSYIDLPNGVRLQKRSVRSDELERLENFDQYIQWTAMLYKPGTGKDNIIHANSIDLRVGCTFDGAVVYFPDKSHTNCGPGRPHTFGGHASKRRDISADDEIVKVEINKHHSLEGIRMTLADGKSWGHINGMYGGQEPEVLEPGPGHKIIGFFGTSAKPHRGYTKEFGIITAPKDLVIDATVLKHRELRNPAEEDEQVAEESEDEEQEEYDYMDEDDDENESQSTME